MDNLIVHIKPFFVLRNIAVSAIISDTFSCQSNTFLELKYTVVNKKVCKVKQKPLLRNKQKWDENYIEIGQDKESGQNATFDAVAYTGVEQAGSPLLYLFIK